MRPEGIDNSRGDHGERSTSEAWENEQLRADIEDVNQLCGRPVISVDRGDRRLSVANEHSVAPIMKPRMRLARQAGEHTSVLVFRVEDEVTKTEVLRAKVVESKRMS